MSGNLQSSYGRQPRDRGSTIVGLTAGGPAERAGVTLGDRLITADGVILRDAIDWLWVADGPSTDIVVQSPGGNSRNLILERKAGESWGLDFAELVFDGVRVCDNECAFCFMSQLPREMRSSLYLKDDDYRLSFLQGNFVTLTNLADEDVDRIVEQRLSPLYVSLHAVDSEVRSMLLSPRSRDTAIDALERLLAEGIETHVQIVLVPGVNDASILEETLKWLTAREGVASVGIVPVGYTGERESSPSYTSQEAAAGFLDWASSRVEAINVVRGAGWLQLADEFYLNADTEVPLAGQYGEFPQFENGIGMARSFVDDFRRRASEGESGADTHPHRTLLTGELFAPVLDGLVTALATETLSVLPVPNGFFGGNVSVTGLLTGSDILKALEHAPQDTHYLVPSCVFNADGVTLDDMSFDQLDRATDASLSLVSCDPDALADALFGYSERA